MDDQLTAPPRGALVPKKKRQDIALQIFETTRQAIVVTDWDARIQMVNAAFCRITGYEPPEAIGQKVSLLKSGRHGPPFYAELWAALRSEGHWQGEIWNKRKNGEVYPEWLSISRIDDGQEAYFVAIFSDISSIKEAQLKTEFFATHDHLTGLPNRILLTDRLDHALAEARRAKRQFALLFIDLDEFKDVNDTFGHHVGDSLLVSVAHRLQACVRDADTLARLGGDEFAVLLSPSDSEIAGVIGRRIATELSQPFPVAGRNHFISASIGIALYPSDGRNAAALLRCSDSAMYRAKASGRNCVEFFEPGLDTQLTRRHQIEDALRESLDEGQPRLVFQPKFTLGEKPRLIGAETLLRWQHPELGEVPPSEFIPIAEMTKLIVKVDRFVYALLLDQIKAWRALALDLPVIAFNVSARSIRETDFVETLIRESNDAGVPRSLLQMEITEMALVESSAVKNLETLHRAGFKISIDDFGTGFSSLNYLKLLPVSELKIDKSFVQGLGRTREDEAIVRAILTLGQALNLNSVAEGIETPEQLGWLSEWGCHIGQGFLFSRPLERSDFEALIAGAGMPA